MRRGFTLVELLVVMSVIALLAALAFPVSIKVRGYARKTQCISNLGQIGKAINAYANEWENWYPYACALPSQEPTPGRARLCDTLKVYTEPNVFLCPDDFPADPAYKFRTYFEGEGSSYEWAETLNAKRIGQASRKRLVNIDVVPMAYDYEPFHRHNSAIGMNILFGDSHVEGL